MIEQLVNFIKKHFYSPLGLLAGFLLIALVIMLPFDDFLEKGVPRFSKRLLIYIGIYGIWVLLWAVFRNYFPKNRKRKIGIVVAIKTENEKQKLLIKNDFVEGVRKLLKENNILSLFQIIVLQDYKANKAGNILDNYGEKKNEYIRRKIYKKFNKTKEHRSCEKLNKKIKGHFYVWGTIKKRQDVQLKYFISLEALVVHRPVQLKASKKIVNEFATIFPKEISILEKLEVKGFEIASSYIFMAIRYITGIAAFVSGDIFTAFNLHNGLQNEIAKHKPTPPNLEIISKRLKELLCVELVQQARYFHLIKRDLNKFKELLAEAEKLNDKDYSILVLNSIKAFQIERNPLKSLQYLKKARRASKGDYTWLYNKAFIYMYLEKFELGFKDYKRLRGLSFQGEDSIVNQCINFNEELLKSEPDKKQSLFIIGYLYYTKKNNLPMALNKFEEFIKETKNETKYECLYVRAKTYLDEIKRGMKLKNTTK